MSNINKPVFRKGSKATSDIKVGIINGNPTLQVNWGGRIYGTPLNLVGSSSLKETSRFGNIRVSGSAIFDSGGIISTLNGDGLTITQGGAFLARFAATTTVKDINLTGKIVISGSGDKNVVMGSADNNDAGIQNVAIGDGAGAALNTNANKNVLIGTQAGEDINNDGADAAYGKSNVFIGDKAGLNVQEGYNNVGIGENAGKGISATTCHDNVALGYNALTGVTTGNYNICLGTASGATIDDGEYNICIGESADTSAADSNNQIAIGEDVSCTGDNKITIGHAANTATLDLDGSDTSWAAASSDKRFKENISTSIAGLSFINDLRPVTYNWKKKKDVPSDTIYYEEGSNEPCLGGSYGIKLHGFIAQEVKTVIDNHSEVEDGFKMWKQYDNGVQTIADGNLVPLLTKAVQELSAKIDNMEERITNLEVL